MNKPEDEKLTEEYAGHLAEKMLEGVEKAEAKAKETKTSEDRQEWIAKTLQVEMIASTTDQENLLTEYKEANEARAEEIKKILRKALTPFIGKHVTKIRTYLIKELQIRGIEVEDLTEEEGKKLIDSYFDETPEGKKYDEKLVDIIEEVFYKINQPELFVVKTRENKTPIIRDVLKTIIGKIDSVPLELLQLKMSSGLTYEEELIQLAKSENFKGENLNFLLKVLRYVYSVKRDIERRSLLNTGKPSASFRKNDDGSYFIRTPLDDHFKSFFIEKTTIKKGKKSGKVKLITRYEKQAVKRLFKKITEFDDKFLLRIDKENKPVKLYPIKVKTDPDFTTRTSWLELTLDPRFLPSAGEQYIEETDREEKAIKEGWEKFKKEDDYTDLRLSSFEDIPTLLILVLKLFRHKNKEYEKDFHYDTVNYTLGNLKERIEEHLKKYKKKVSEAEKVNRTLLKISLEIAKKAGTTKDYRIDDKKKLITFYFPEN